MYKMISFGLSDIGSVRKNNEDSFSIGGFYIIVADGMGGAAAGEVASTTAVKIISDGLERLSYIEENKLTDVVGALIEKADMEIRRLAVENPEYRGMGTTAVILIHAGDKVLLANVGDSRAYRISSGKPKTATGHADVSDVDLTASTAIFEKISDDVLKPAIERMTVDHSVVMDLVRTGVITEAEIRTHPMRNRITRCLGSQGDNTPDFLWADIQDGDIFLLCSDGLWEMVHEDIMTAVSGSSEKFEDIGKKLVEAANNNGGVDNITVGLAKFQQI